MSYQLIRSHRLYVSSENRDPNDSPSNFRMEIGNNLITLDDPATQRMKISLMNFTCDCLWFEINSLNNSFVLTNNTTHVASTIVIPIGNYTFQKLASIISHLYPECLCQWIQETNSLLMTFAVNHTLNFIGASYNTLGFYIGDDGVSGTQIVSTKALKTRANNIIYMRLNDIIQANDCINLDNLDTVHGKPSNILCCVPVNATPFQTIFYDNSVYGRDMGIYASNPRLNALNITLTDKYNKELDYISDWQAQFLVEIFDEQDDSMDAVIESLNGIEQTLKQMLVLKFI